MVAGAHPFMEGVFEDLVTSRSVVSFRLALTLARKVFAIFEKKSTVSLKGQGYIGVLFSKHFTTKIDQNVENKNETFSFLFSLTF